MIIAWDKELDVAVSPQREPVNGEWALFPSGFKKQYNEPVITSPKPIVPMTNLVVSSEATLTGSIYWLTKDVVATVTADLALPDGEYMIIAERVVDATQVIDDTRFVATVLNGELTMTVSFETTGNYVFSADRMNKGLDRIGAPMHLGFDTIEFDIHI